MTGQEERIYANKKILVVDDEQELCDFLKEDLSDSGYLVSTANSYDEAIAVLKQNPDIKVVITDVRMPGKSGVDLLQTIIQDDPPPIVFFNTGFSDVTLEEAYDMGVAAVFQKPIKVDIVIEELERMVLAREQKWSRESDRIDAKIDLHIDVGESGAFQKKLTLNIGQGGMFVGASEDFPEVNDQVSFLISVEGGQAYSTIEGVGVCRWVRKKEVNGVPSGFGLEFQSFSSQSRSEMLRLMNDIKTKSYIPKS